MLHLWQKSRPEFRFSPLSSLCRAETRGKKVGIMILLTNPVLYVHIWISPSYFSISHYCYCTTQKCRLQQQFGQDFIAAPTPRQTLRRISTSVGGGRP